MKQAYENWEPRRATLELIGTMNGIITQYGAQGLVLTVRQLYYQLVTRNVVPNTERSYKNVVSAAGKARMAGLMDWAAIEDRLRAAKTNPHWEGVQNFMGSVIPQYQRDHWRGQSQYVELWVEKDALSGVLIPICEEHDMPLMVNRGYSSLSAMRRSAGRITNAQNVDDSDHRPATILYLGDHDPSGLDMVRDVQERLWAFGADVTVKHIALTMEQVEEYNPPPNPTKLTDSRAKGYIADFGYESWEVDALDPPTLRQLIDDLMADYIDCEAMDEVIAEEDKERTAMTAFAKGYKSEDRLAAPVCFCAHTFGEHQKVSDEAEEAGQAGECEPLNGFYCHCEEYDQS